NKPLRVTTYTDKESPSEEKKYSYDEKGNTLSTRVTKDGVIRSELTVTFQYDDHGNWIRALRYEKGQLLDIITRKYQYFH
ncbi:MAG: hypothetical protein LWW85_13455, partial [Marinilabiliales bacterium]|nr:hypothetical protein [Marinilabiliales bacterium]